MEYRGIKYSVTEGSLGIVWKWSVLVGEPEMLRAGEAPSAQQAEMQVRHVIDRAIAVLNTLRRSKPSEPTKSGG